MSVSKNRLLDKKFIKKRWNKLRDLGLIDFWNRLYSAGYNKKEFEDYKLKNNNIMNKEMHGGCPKKRKARHASITYRHHGTYGKAIQRNRNELRQYEDMNQQMEEFMNGEEG